MNETYNARKKNLNISALFSHYFFVLAGKFVLQQCMHLSKWTKDKSSKSAVGTEAWVRSNPNWMLV